MDIFKVIGTALIYGFFGTIGWFLAMALLKAMKLA
jgi:hypothetical protein